jgi:hypothetical protein
MTCYICLEDGNKCNPLISSSCKCKSKLHQKCFDKMIENNHKKCGICKEEFKNISKKEEKIEYERVERHEETNFERFQRLEANRQIRQSVEYLPVNRRVEYYQVVTYKENACIIS